ncbi:hypothetical protein CEW88_09970 [Alloyangia pacifica]|uniref:DUF883 domain-containing protein n=1 Tax=Alloyangia pacifica TaxID=311180 RepID=A0A2U8HG25_9RHOB|nr:MULTISPECIES: DUF883 family protein [Roseobacteraceae]AWI83976.1 hypothetical protein CEW88_09970 [Alloyangia pacifica]NDV51093.1 DUF883 domain-containing protein [Salipiger sp. PrR003]NDW33851.1 DUF883 domain-containing protein [Salipiger sp. PrR007]
MAQTATKSNDTPKVAETLQGDGEALSDQIKTLRADVASLAELVGDIGKRRGAEYRAAGEAKAQEVRDRGEEALREAGQRVAELENNARGQIQANPFQAIGLAAAVGFLIGYVGSRR